MPCPPLFWGLLQLLLLLLLQIKASASVVHAKWPALIPHFFRHSQTCPELTELAGKGKPCLK